MHRKTEIIFNNKTLRAKSTKKIFSHLITKNVFIFEERNGAKIKMTKREKILENVKLRSQKRFKCFFDVEIRMLHYNLLFLQKKCFYYFFGYCNC